MIEEIEIIWKKQKETIQILNYDWEYIRGESATLIDPEEGAGFRVYFDIDDDIVIPEHIILKESEKEKFADIITEELSKEHERHTANW